MKCEWCSTVFTPKSPRSKFCTEACKQKNKRKQKIDSDLIANGLPPTVQASKIPVPPKKQDAPMPEAQSNEQTYTAAGRPTPGSPEWYVYGTHENPDQTWDRGCVVCGKAFETPLQLMRFCSADCKKDVFVALANGPHKGHRL